MTTQQVKDIINECLQDAYNATYAEVAEWIKEHVPKATGQLQESLLANLDSSKVSGTHLTMRTGTHLNYMQYVNQMPSSMLRHSPPSGRYIYYFHQKGWVELDDPGAYHDFWSLLKKHIRERLRINLKLALQARLGTGDYGKFAQQMKVAK